MEMLQKKIQKRVAIKWIFLTDCFSSSSRRRHAALTVFVVHTESLKATSLIHAGKFSKLLNTTTSTTSTSTTEEPPHDLLGEKLDETADDEVSWK